MYSAFPLELTESSFSSLQPVARKTIAVGRVLVLSLFPPLSLSLFPVSFLPARFFQSQTRGTIPHSRFKWLLNTGVAIDDLGLTGGTGREALNFNRDTEKC